MNIFYTDFQFKFFPVGKNKATLVFVHKNSLKTAMIRLHLHKKMFCVFLLYLHVVVQPRNKTLWNFFRRIFNL